MANNYGTGIPLATGFDLSAAKALDHRTVKSTLDERDAMSDELYEGLIVYVEETKVTYQCISTNPIKWGFVGGAVHAGDGLGESVTTDNQTTIYHKTKPSTGTALTTTIDTSKNTVITEISLDKFGHVASAKSRTLFSELTWERLVSLFNANGFTLSEGSLVASELYASNLVTWNSGNPTIVEGNEDPEEGRDQNALIQVTWSQIVTLFNSHGFTINNGTITAETLNADNLVTYE